MDVVHQFAVGETSTLRQVADVDLFTPIYLVSEQGQVRLMAQLSAAKGGLYTLRSADRASPEMFEGIPFFLRDLRPQGFLGRLEPLKNPDLDLPQDILLWTDEQVLQYLSRRSEHAAGNLILGDESYARYLSDLPTIQNSLIAAVDRSGRYPRMADLALQGNPPGSSAAGEQPKFTAAVQRDNEHGTIEFVIVKFSPQIDSESGRRWGDLLICEHLALEVLARHHIAAANTSIVESGARVFLEVVRFDRIGLKGRRPVATLAALDGDLAMLDQNWSTVARELERLGRMSAQDVEKVEILDLYGTLIGNTDRHHGNLAVSWSLDGRLQLLDAYDMLPMFYRPSANGEIVDRDWRPHLAGKLQLRHLPLCLEMANQFWSAVLADIRISQEFKRDIASRHRKALQTLQGSV